MAKFNTDRVRRQRVTIVRPRLKERFRWGMILLPGVVLLVLWLASGVSIGFTWDEVMDVLHVRNRSRYTQLAILGLICVGVVAIARVLRGPPTGEKDE